jgi:hypothetical protein
MHDINIKVNNPHNFTGGITICDIKIPKYSMRIMRVYIYKLHMK